MTDTAALIEKLQQATEGSRGLDTEIAKSLPYNCDPTAEYDTEEDCLVWNEIHSEVDGCPFELCYQDLPHYTTSLDAALTLVNRPVYLGSIVRAYAVSDEPMWSVVLVGPEGGGFPLGNWEEGRVEGYGSTPALALCIAALKAKEDIEND